MKHGPNVNKIIAAKAAKDLTPPGSNVGTVAAAIRRVATQNGRAQAATVID
jgi:hypothetical protein